MRYTFAIITYAAALLLTPQFALAAANTGACYNIQDADARAYCLALAHRDPGRCYNIHASDLRALCQSEVASSAEPRDRGAEKRACPIVPRTVWLACIAKANQ